MVCTLLGCARPPAPSEPAPKSGEISTCEAPPPELGRDLDRPLTLTPCSLTLAPAELDLAARAHTRETIAALGPADPYSLELANDVAFAELSATHWEVVDPARLREAITTLESLVDDDAQARSPVRDQGLMALVCLHALLDGPESAQARAQELLRDHSGMWIPYIYLALAELADEQDTAIALYEQIMIFDGAGGYAKYRLAWALRHPTIVDQERAIELLEQLVEDPQTWPRLDRLLRHRAALELRALGREVEVPPRGCD